MRFAKHATARLERNKAGGRNATDASKQTPEIRIIQFPANPERERFMTEIMRELIGREVLRSFGVDITKVPKRRKKKRA